MCISNVMVSSVDVFETVLWKTFVGRGLGPGPRRVYGDRDLSTVFEDRGLSMAFVDRGLWAVFGDQDL